MKKQKFLFTMMVTVLAFSSCNDELENAGGTPIATGDEIQFGAADLATFGEGYSEVPQSRTAYGDSYFQDEKWHYPLDWVYGDGISVYCPQASGDMKYTDYTIEWANGQEGAVQTDGDLAYMMKVGENGLHWGEMNQLHKFYAFYPTSAIKNDEAFAKGIVHATIPNVQEMTWKSTIVDGKTHWVGRPNMQYAFMRGYGEVTPQEATDNKVKLEFKPLTTAVEVTLEAADDLSNTAQISQLQVQAINKDRTQSQPVCGDFTYNIDNGTTTFDNDAVANDYMISVRCWHMQDGIQKPIELRAGDKLTFTVFLLPRTDDENSDRTLHNLQIRVPGWNSTAKVKTYEGINIPVRTKSQIILPKYQPATEGANNWIGGLPQNVYISQLSIPGSVNAFSFDIKNDEKNSYQEGSSEIDQTQTLTVEEQFNMGVRAFEIATERDGSNTSNSLGNGQVIAGETTNNLTFDAALRRLANLVKANPSEFVIVMPYYAPDDTQNNPAWRGQLKTYFKNLNGVINDVPIKPFDNSMTIEQAKGSILLLSRIPGGIDEFDPQYTTAIYGWDSDKNRWRKRGYNFDSWDGESEPNKSSEPTLDTWRYDSESPASTSGKSPTFYVQDWFRVCAETKSYNHPFIVKGFGGFSSTKWYESKTEKIGHIQQFMRDAITELKGDVTGSKVFINSLAGYYVADNRWGRSAIPYSTVIYPDYGKHGDIPPFARDMNNEVYNFVLGLNYENRGPLGIILINYAGDPEAFQMKMHGDYIVKALIDNNYSFELIGSK